MLLPIITAQTLLFIEGKQAYSVNAILGRVREAMLSTSTQDVEYLQKFIDLSREQSESWLRVFSRANAAHPGHRGGQEQWPGVGPSQK